MTVDYNFNMRFTTNGIMAFSPSMEEYATMWIEANKEQKTKDWWNWTSEENMLKMQQESPVFIIRMLKTGDMISSSEMPIVWRRCLHVVFLISII